MKKILSFLIATSLVVASFAQATEQKLSEKVKLVFPGKPEEMKAANGANVYTFKKDNGVAYMGMSYDLSGMGLTADIISSAGDGLWGMLKGGLTASLAGATIVKDEITPFKGKSSLYLEIDGSTSTEPLLKGKKANGYLFFIGTVLHQVLFYSADSSAKKEDATAFFDSVVIAE